MAISGNVSFKVTPSKVVEKANVVSQKLEHMQRSWNEITTAIDRTNGFWKGQAGDLYRKMYEEQKDNINGIMKELKDHPVDLIAIAKTYSDVEIANEEIAQDLTISLS